MFLLARHELIKQSGLRASVKTKNQLTPYFHSVALHPHRFLNQLSSLNL